MDPDQKAHQLMTELFTRAVDDGKRLYPKESAEYALSVMSACLGLSMKVLMRKCTDSEVESLKTMLEHTIAISETMAKRDG